jgi:hypothetical protein
MDKPAFPRLPALCLVGACLVAFGTPPARADRADLVTEFEKSGGRRTSTHEQMTAYLRRLDAAADWVRVTRFGTTPEGRDLHLVVVDRHGRFDPRRAHARDNAVVLVQAGIHAGEIDGKDAGLMLIRAMAVEKTLAPLLDHVTLLFVPIFNVDGHERRGAFNRPNQIGPEDPGFRTTSRNLNLNRDYMKADAAEMRAWLALFDRWQPDFLIDCHVTDGADYQYVVTYSAEVWASGDSTVAEWTARAFVAPVAERMRAAGLPLSPYVYLRDWDDLTSGIRSGPSTPRFSTGYAALRNRPALLIETHSLKDYATRVRGTYEMLRHSLAVIGAEGAALRALLTTADAHAAALEGRTIPLQFEPDYSDSSAIDFLGFDYSVEHSDVTGGRWVRYAKTPRTFTIPFFSRQRVTAAATVPAAYVIPAPWTEAIDRIRAHGIECGELARPVTLDVSTYRFSHVAWEERPFEGRHVLSYDVTPATERVTFPVGSLVVDTAQPLARVLVHLLEPDAPDALVRWGLFDATFEQKEYLEGYVIEGEIRRMLAGNPKLASEFAEARKDSAFARDSERIRHWFYERSPYADGRVGLYPVGRILNRAALETLPLRQGRS